MSITTFSAHDFKHRQPQSLATTGFAVSFAKYVTLRKKNAGKWKNHIRLSSVTSCGCVL